MVQNFRHIQDNMSHLQTYLEVFANLEKLLKQVNGDWAFRAVKSSQMKHYQCLRYALIYKPILQNLQTRQNMRKNCLKLEITVLNIPPLNNLQHQHLRCIYLATS